MNKERLYGEIRNAYAIRSKKEPGVLVSDPDTFLPVVFKNTKDAYSYLDKFADEEDRELADISFRAIQFFDRGAILITNVNKEDKNMKKYYVFAEDKFNEYEFNGEVYKISDIKEGDIIERDEISIDIFDSMLKFDKFTDRSVLFEVALENDSKMYIANQETDEMYVNKVKVLRKVSAEEVDSLCEAHKEEMLHSDNLIIRMNAASRKFDLETSIKDYDSRVRAVVVSKGYGLDKLVNDPDGYVRICVAYQGYGLDKLVNDPDPCVRVAVVNQGYGLDKLVHDPYPIVRREIASEGSKKYLKILKDDPDDEVRSMVAYRGYKLEKFKDDPSSEVRIEVVNHGKFLGKFLNDHDPEVRLETIKYILRHAIDDPDIVKSVKEFIDTVNWENLK